MVTEVQEFRPVCMSRQGEVVTWGVWGVVTVAWMWLARLGDVPLFIPLFWAVLVVMAVGATLGNWMDARTLLRLTADGVFFYNGLRKVWLPWDEVQKIEVLPSRWGQVLHVWGRQGHFRLRTLSAVHVAGRPEAVSQMGFPHGEEIVRELSHRSGLQVRKQDKAGHYYYARE